MQIMRCWPHENSHCIVDGVGAGARVYERDAPSLSEVRVRLVVPDQQRMITMLNSPKIDIAILFESEIAPDRHRGFLFRLRRLMSTSLRGSTLWEGGPSACEARKIAKDACHRNCIHAPSRPHLCAKFDLDLKFRVMELMLLFET